MKKEKLTTIDHPGPIPLDAKIHYEVTKHKDVNGLDIYNPLNGKHYVDSIAEKVTIYYPIDFKNPKEYIQIVFTTAAILDLALEIQDLEGEMIQQF
jgi:hypothetical protein